MYIDLNSLITIVTLTGYCALVVMPVIHMILEKLEVIQ